MSDVQFLDTPRPEDQVQFLDTPRPEDGPGFLSKAASNVMPDLESVGKSLITPFPKKAMGLAELGAEKYASGESALDIAGDAAKSIAEPVMHPVKFAEEHPVQQALNAASVFGLGKGMLAPEAVPAEIGAAEAPSIEAAGVPKLEEPVPMRTTPEPKLEPASRVPPDPNAPPPPAAAASPAKPAGPRSVVSDLSNLTNALPDKAKEVKSYISRGYQGFAKKPGAIADVADYIQEKSQMMAAQQLGATPLQARQIGHEGMRAIGQYALDHDIVGPTTGLRGMRQINEKLLNAAGEKIGAFRKMADQARVPEANAIDVLQQVRAKLDPKYTRGSYSGEAGTYAKALEDVEDAQASHQGLADVASKLNDAANKANRINQPHNAYTDVANEISHINNERIKSVLGPAKATQYEQALREYGVNKKIASMLERKAAGEVKRLGPGSLTSNMTQKLLDEVGYKVGAKAANKLSTSVLKNPAIGKSLPSLFKEFINHVDDIGHEVTGLSDGGLVSPEMADFVRAK